MHSTLIFLFFATGAFVDDVFSYSTNNRFSNVVVFGDSYSDTGNVYALTSGTWPIVPPYYQGRYCDNLNWVDNLNVAGKIDYAYGSATTDNNLVQGLAKENTVPVPGVLQQVQTYLNDPMKASIRSSNPVYIIWASANDFMFNPLLPPAVVAASLMESVQALLNIGTSNIIVFNSVPLQALPSASTTVEKTLLTLTTNELNAAIYTNLELLQLVNFIKNPNLHLFDINTFTTNIINNPPSPITNVVNNCWTVYNITTVIQNCTDPTKYLFLDIIHFSSTVQNMIAEAIQPFFYDGYTKNAPGSYIHSF